MNKLSTLLILISIATSSAISQQIHYTTWEIYDTNNVFKAYYHFDGDSLGLGQTLGNYNNFSAYFVSGNEIRFLDPPSTEPGACSSTDTAIYTFEFKSDSLDFTYVHDSCYGRYLTVALYGWVNESVGLSEKTESNDGFLIFPNPVNKRLFIESFAQDFTSYNYSIVNNSGVIVGSGRIEDPLYSIDVEHLPSGMYFFIGDGYMGIRQKFLKE